MGRRQGTFTGIVKHDEHVILETVVRENILDFKDFEILSFVEIEAGKFHRSVFFLVWFSYINKASSFVEYVLFKSEEVQWLFVLTFDKQADSEPSLALVLHGDDADELKG